MANTNVRETWLLRLRLNESTGARNIKLIVELRETITLLAPLDQHMSAPL